MAPNATSGVQKTLGRAVTVTVTLAVFGAAGAAGLAGYAMIASGTERPAGQTAPLTSVRVMTVTPQDRYTVARRFTGQIEAAAQTDLGFELGGRITDLVVEEGELVAAGTVLGQLDKAALIPERAALEAELAGMAADAELARLTLARNDALTERGFRSVAAQDDARLALARAEAGMAAIRARISGVDVRLEKSVLKAPFAARIGARMADPGQTVAAGQPVLVLFDAAPAQARVGLPPDLAAGLAVGDAVLVAVGEYTHDARILQVRADLDPATRSRSVMLSLPDGAAPVLGDTVTLILDQTIPEPGFWVPLAALREGVRGSWSVMAIEATVEGDRTVPSAVEVIHSEGSQVYLRGILPPGARIVATAPDRVAPGQIIDAKAE